jgi:hypothetical protein
MSRHALCVIVFGGLLLSSSAWAIPQAGSCRPRGHARTYSALGPEMCLLLQDPWQDCNEDPWQLTTLARPRAEPDSSAGCPASREGLERVGAPTLPLPSRSNDTFSDPWQDSADPWQPFTTLTPLPAWQPVVTHLAPAPLSGFPSEPDPWQDGDARDFDPWQVQ